MTNRLQIGGMNWNSMIYLPIFQLKHKEESSQLQGKIKNMRRSKTGHYMQIDMFNQHNSVALGVHSKQQNNAHQLAEKEVEQSEMETYQAQGDFTW